jgi:hypothetical protein
VTKGQRGGSGGGEDPAVLKVTAAGAASATGSQSRAFQMELLEQLSNTLWRPAWKTEAQQVQAAQAAYDALNRIAPQDELEGMLAVQMIATHNAATECLRRAMMEGQTFEGRDQNLKHATKLMGVYERQLAALDKHRGKGQQKITVEHVTVEAGGQAIVGSVTSAAPSTRGAKAPPAQSGAALDYAPAADAPPITPIGGRQGASSSRSKTRTR